MTTQALAIREDMPLEQLGTILAKSGFFLDAQDAGKAIVKVLAGRELGIPAIASMCGIYIVKGRVSLSANIMAALVKRSGKYNYRVIEHTALVCEIAFFEGAEKVGTSRFGADDARKAGTQNMEKYSRNMLFARAMSNGVKWYCPDVTGGPAYTPEEMGVQVDGDGDVIDVPAQAPATPTNGHGQPKADPDDVPVGAASSQESLYPEGDPDPVPGPLTVITAKPARATRPYAPEVVQAKIGKGAAKHSGQAASRQQRGLLVGVLNDCCAGDEQARHLVTEYLTGEASSKDVPDAYVLALLDWLAATKDSGGAWAASPMAEREAALVLRQARTDSGQAELPLPA